MTDRICSLPDCERKHYARGWCKFHYQRVRQMGSPHLRPPAPLEPLPGEEWRPVAGYKPRYRVSSIGRVYSELVGIMKLSDSHGYFVVGLEPISRSEKSKTNESVHVLVAAAFIGPRPPGLVVRHLNGIRHDLRVENLAYGTVKQNAEDMVRHERSARSNTHCRKGHEFTPESTAWQNGEQFRYCRTCRNDRRRGLYRASRSRTA